MGTDLVNFSRMRIIGVGIILIVLQCQAATVSFPMTNHDGFDQTTDTFMPKSTIKSEQPSLTKVEPNYGPVSGGTAITISGRDWACMSNAIHVRFNGRDILRMDCTAPTVPDVIECTTPSVNGSTAEAFQVQALCEKNQTIHWITTDPVYFTYMPDPRIQGVYPNTSILAGGITQTVTGEHLDSVANPTMFTTYRNPQSNTVTKTYSSCARHRQHNSTVLKCKTGSVSMNDDDLGNNSVSNQPEEILSGNVWVGFNFDGVPGLKNYPIHMFYDPKLEHFKPETKIFLVSNDNTLSVEGVWPRMTFSSDDIKVKVGAMECTEVKLDQNNVTCHAPMIPKHVIRYGPTELNTLDVVVFTGNSMYNLGKLHYTAKESFHVVMIVMIALLAFIIVISIAFGCLTLFGLRISGCMDRSRRKPPFQSVSSYDSPVDGGDTTVDPHGSQIEFGRRPAKRDEMGQSGEIECVAMQYKGDRYKEAL